MQGCRAAVGLFLVAFAFLLCPALAVTARAVMPTIVYPGSAWTFKTPAELGLNAAKLDQVAALIGGHGCIIRDGYMVKTWGSQSTKGDWASAAKPVVTTLLFYAIEEARVAGVDTLIRDQGWSLNAKDGPMTFRHLANMTASYARAEAPGAAWAYNDYAIQLYVETLFDKVYRQNPNTVATAPARLGALQFQDGSIFSSRGGYGVSTSVRDFARIGWFWANRGHWNGAQLLPQHYFDEFMKPQVPASLLRTSAAASDYLGVGTYGGTSDQTSHGPGIYGFNWWFNAKGATSPAAMTWPDAPPDTFQANGHWGGEVITVIPSLRMVMAHFQGANTGLTPGSSTTLANRTLKLLVESVPPVTTVLPDLDGDADVDQTDFGYLQACFSESNEGGVSLACQPADLNRDSIVDQADVDLLQACLSGPKVPADTTCDDGF